MGHQIRNLYTGAPVEEFRVALAHRRWGQTHIASVAEWLNAADCKSAGLSPTEVRILPGAPFQ